MAIPDELCIEAVNALAQYGSKQAAAKALGLARSTFRDRLTRAAQRGLDGSTPHPLPPGQTVKGTSTLYGPEGTPVLQWVKTTAEPSVEDIAGILSDVLSEHTGKSIVLPSPSRTEDDLATVYVCADWHLGMLSWAKETGHNYDLKIADKTIRSSMERLVSCAPDSEQAVVLGLGDLLHSDGYEPVTSRSKNPLDVDGRWPRVLKCAASLMVATVDLALQKHEQVLVRILPGNHDDQSAVAVSLALALFYSNNPRVIVDDSPSRFWWWSWGCVFLGATHGDMAKMKDLPLIMAARNPEAWGKSKFRAILTGHIHTQTAIELSGVTVESFQTPAAPDAWHHAKGYGATRSMTAITYSKERGEVCRNKVNIL